MKKNGAALLLAAALVALPAHALPTFAAVKSSYRPSDVTLLARDGSTPLQTVRTDPSVRRLPWLALDDVSPALLTAIVLSEDRRFWQHAGVDWGAVAKSAWANAWNTRTRGASTLTMQLAGLIDAELARPAGGRGVATKVAQALSATRLDAAWKKSEILEAYLNLAAWRGEVVGVNALAQTLFGKHASGLDAHEAALAAALLRGPNASAATVAERACGVLALQRLSCAGLDVLAEVSLARRGAAPLGEQLAPHAARRLLSGKAGSPAAIVSTLDAGVQRIAVEALRRHLGELAGRHVEDGAVLVLDNASGEVLAWVGSSGPALSAAAEVDGVTARRQPGSTLKPFVYELAFERRLITPASLLDDSPAQLSTAAGIYAPRNYDRSHRGWVSARTALASSLNVPAVRVGEMLGADALFERLDGWGLALSESAGFHGHALALGGADVTLLQLANAYRALANGGVLSPVRLRRDEGEPVAVAPKRVADPAAVHLVTDILADNAARAATFGLDSALAGRRWAAVKTGTSKDMRDNWCVGYTRRHTVGVWVGNASGQAMHDVSGTHGAAPVWRAVVGYLDAASPVPHDRAPPRPAGVVALPIRYEGAIEPPRSELFVAGTEQAVQRAAGGTAGSPRRGIASPRDGSLYAIDPDMPPAAQRITFEGEDGGVWVLDGRRLGRGARWSWPPWPGRHELALLGADGREVQRVRFEVRGAGVIEAAATARPRQPASTRRISSP